jgi:hypothetical protein
MYPRGCVKAAQNSGAADRRCRRFTPCRTRTLTSRNNLVTVLRDLNQSEEAEK